MAAPVDAKLLRKTKFPPEFSRKVDMQKVNIEVMKKWIAGRISEILGNEDDVVIELCFGLIEGTRYPDIKAIQIQLTGFLDKDTPKFCKDLWLLCLSGQENPQGVPKELLEAKKLELIQEKAEAERAAESARRQREQDMARERELGDIRNRERGARGDRERGQRGSGRNRAFDGNFERRRSRSPPRRNRSRDRYREPPPRRNFDSYVPSSSNQGRHSRSPSRSRSPHSPPRSSIREPRHAGRARSPGRRRTYSRSISPNSRKREGTRRSPDYGDRHRSIDQNNSRSPIPRDEPGHRSFSRSVSPSSRHQDRKNSGSNDLPRYRPRSRSRERGRGRYEPDASRFNDEQTRGRGYGRRRSRSRSRSPRREHERRRSLERYNPAAHRKRDPSVSTPDKKQPKNADQPEDPPTPKPIEMEPKAEDQEMKDAE
ncbi:hypothetical protein N7494_008095 [Penicillium frequentans]|uniref:PWI domain-containing protein n=1 Tax=Penicillium frequentans TaxID=3151616 RepID=A0AAD6GFD4_9EURO|nr:hypothetical protein N7494_008095 [Penicillium glabrum]